MYIPILKTTSAEINGYQNIAKDIKEKILPLFELTKDRTHKKNYPEGRVEKALEKALGAQDVGRLILDLTSHEDLINSEIESLFDSNNGYKNWCSFINNTGQQHRIIPVIQVDADQIDNDIASAENEIKEQTLALFSMCGHVAFRATLDIEIDELKTMLSWISDALPNQDRLIFILDCGYIKPHTASIYADEVLKYAVAVAEYCNNQMAVSASSFPKTVTAPNYGQDGNGQWDLEEVKLHALLNERNNFISWLYSDYALIHPIRYDIRGSTWVPRVDVPLEKSVFYHRYRREEGGYIAAAKKVVADPLYTSVNSWGNKQIEDASINSPAGLSPAFWISVRANIHIITQEKRTATIP